MTESSSIPDSSGDKGRHQLGVGHRLKQAPSAAMGAAMNSELKYAQHVAHGLSCADLAHVIMLAEQDVIPQDAARKLLGALLELHQADPENWIGHFTEGDLYDHRDAWLRERIGSLSGWLHTARARREAINLGWLIGLKSGAAALQAGMVACLESALRLCARHRQTLMPDFTYLQHAHPTTLGHYLLGFFYPLERDLRRLEDIMADLDACPAGSVSTNGTRLPVDRDRMRELLGFSSLIHHNRDAMWQTDLPIHLMAILVSIHTTIDRLAEEWLIWCTSEFDFLELADAHCRTSVIMPQKKNPYSLAHLRGRARAMTGRFVSIVATNQTPTGQVDNRTSAYSLLPESLRETHDSVALLAEIMEQAVFNESRLEEMAGEGACWATELVEFLIQSERIDARTAHSLVGALTSTLPASTASRGLIQQFRQVYAAKLQRECAASDDVLAAVFDPRAIVAARATAGSCGPGPLAEMLQSLGQSVERHKSRCRDANAGFDSRLVAMARQMAEPSAPPP